VTSPTPGFGLLADAVSYALVSAGFATPELLSRATPCAGWDLRELLNHVSDSLDVLHDAVGAGCVRPGLEPGDGAESDSDPVRALRCRAGRLLTACAAAGAGEHLIAIADRVLTPNVVAVAGAIEVSVHGWDISVACGRRGPIPPLLAAQLLYLAPALIPAGTRDGLFAEPVSLPTPAGCPSDHLVAFLGRHPGWPAAPG
jgi:uncharacterized protein (TIGR03086 family)